MPDEGTEQLDMSFRRPDSYVVSVRLNAEESRELTAAARRAGERLSTFIKAAALDSVRRHNAAHHVQVSLGDDPWPNARVSIRAVIGSIPPESATTAGRNPESSWSAPEGRFASAS